MQKKKAFTLAEVLITLGIIGVVAALTIPALMNKTNDKETVVAVKKAYSILSQAYTMAIQDDGPPDTWDLVGPLSEVGAVNVLNQLAPYMKINKNCGITESGCFYMGNYKTLNGNADESIDLGGPWATAIIADGMTMAILIRSDTCTDAPGSTPALKSVCGDIAIDVNGYKRPNIYGKDYFRFHFTKSGIIPKGTKDDSGYPCVGAGAGNGEGCTAWVVYNENLDYLKSCSSTLSWSGPTKCG